MEKLFIDESGSMTVSHFEVHPYFIIAIVKAKNPDNIKRQYKKFVRKNYNILKENDKKGCMFRGDTFLELKGNSLTPNLKKEFVSFICKNNSLELFYIVCDNTKVKPYFYHNTARAFNYLLRQAFDFFLSNGYIEDGIIDIQLDERNEKTETKYFLENYLNTEIGLNRESGSQFKVRYFDSSSNQIIQVADIFSNLLFSQYMTNGYTDVFKHMRENGYLKYTYKFPYI